MFSFKKDAQTVEIEARKMTIDNLKREIEDIKSSRSRDFDSIVCTNKREVDDLNSSHRREIDSITSSNKISLLEKDAEIKSLQNKIARIESEMEARLTLQEDIHADEILALEEKYKAMEVNLEEKYKAKDDALDTMQEMDKKHMNAQAEELLAKSKSTAANIIEQAYKEAFLIKQESIDSYQSIINMLSIQLGNKNDIEQLVDLVKASTENYPSFPTKISSTSSSK